MIVINSEICSGLAVFTLGLLFYIAGLVNPIWATIFVVDYLIMAIGAATIGIGVWTLMDERKNLSHTEYRHH